MEYGQFLLYDSMLQISVSLVWKFQHTVSLKRKNRRKKELQAPSCFLLVLTAGVPQRAKPRAEEMRHSTACWHEDELQNP